jgi:hypothetical protein
MQSRCPVHFTKSFLYGNTEPHLAEQETSVKACGEQGRLLSSWFFA